MADTMQTVSLLSILPPNLQSDAQVQAAAKALDAELLAATDAIDEALLLPRLGELPENVIDLLAWQWHVDFYNYQLPIEKKRAMVRQAIAWHKRKGTPSVVQEVVSAIYSGGNVTEWFDYDGQPYHFRVETTGVIGSDIIYTQLQRMINAVKNVRSWLDGVYIKRSWNASMYFGAIARTGKTLTINPAAFSAQTAKNSQYMRGGIHKGASITIGRKVT